MNNLKLRRRLTFAEAENRASMVFSLFAANLNRRAIAREMGISPELVSYYRSPICKAAYRAKIRA